MSISNGTGKRATSEASAGPPKVLDPNDAAVLSNVEKNWLAGSTMYIRFNDQTIPSPTRRERFPLRGANELGSRAGRSTSPVCGVAVPPLIGVRYLAGRDERLWYHVESTVDKDGGGKEGVARAPGGRGSRP